MQYTYKGYKNKIIGNQLRDTGFNPHRKLHINLRIKKVKLLAVETDPFTGSVSILTTYIFILR